MSLVQVKLYNKYTHFMRFIGVAKVMDPCCTQLTSFKKGYLISDCSKIIMLRYFEATSCGAWKLLEVDNGYFVCISLLCKYQPFDHCIMLVSIHE